MPAVTVANLEFVGRNRELKLLRSLFSRASDGQGGAIAVAGASGIGKTRLVEEAIADARTRWPDVLVAECRCRPHSDPLNPSGPFATLLGSAHNGARSSKRHGAKVLRIVRHTAPDWLAVIPVAGPFASAGAKTVTAALETTAPFGASYGLVDSLIQQYASALRMLAAEGAQVILVLEDAQWLARPGYELLASVAETATPAGIAVVVTYDPQALDRERPLESELSRIRLRVGMEHLLLHGLSRSALERALYARYGGALHRQFAGWLVDFCAGNPLVVAHYLDFLERRGDITLSTNRGALSPNLLAAVTNWDAEIAPSADDVPLALREMLRLRIDELAEDDREILRVASVQGSRFEVGLLATLSGQPERDVARRLRELERKTGFIAFVDRDHLDAGPQSEIYEFESGLLHSVFYGELRSGERVRYHKALADLLDRIVEQGAPGQQILGQIGRHRLAARDAPRATQAFLVAGRVAQRDGRLLDAMEMSRRARAAAKDRALRAQAGLMLLASSEPWWGSAAAEDDSVHALLTETLEDAAATGSSGVVAQAELAMARYLRERGEQGPARDAMRRALVTVSDGDDVEAKFITLLTLGYATSPVDLRAGLRTLRSAEELFEKNFGTPCDSMTRGLFGLLQAYIGVGEFDRGQFAEAERRLLEALRMLEESERSGDIPRVLSFLGQLDMATGAFIGAEQHFKRAMEMLATGGPPAALAGYNTALLGKLSLEREDLVAAKPALAEAVSVLASTQHVDFQMSARTYLAELLLREDAADEAVHECRWVIERAVKAGYPGFIASGSSLMAASHLRSGRTTEALAASMSAIGLLDRYGALVLARTEEIHLRHAQVLRACDEPEAAQQFIRRAVRAVREKAASLTDEAARNRFLTAVAVNVAILDEAAADGAGADAAIT